MTHHATAGHAHRICAERGVPWERPNVWAALEQDDLLAVCFARLLLFSDPMALPMVGEVQAAWKLYAERTWRPGKPHPETWPGYYDEARAALGLALGGPRRNRRAGRGPARQQGRARGRRGGRAVSGRLTGEQVVAITPITVHNLTRQWRQRSVPFIAKPACRPAAMSEQKNRIAHRDRAAARRFFERAFGLHDVPEKIAIDKSGANTAAVHGLIAASGATIELRRNGYLNNIVEQDHHVTKGSCRCPGFKSFDSAAQLIAGIESMHMINLRGSVPAPRAESCLVPTSSTAWRFEAAVSQPHSLVTHSFLRHNRISS